MIIYEFIILELVMHLLLLIVVFPFLVLFAGLGLIAFTLLASLFFEFPLALFLVVGLGVLRHYLVNLDGRRSVPCEQM